MLEINDTKPERKLIYSSKTLVCVCVCACVHMCRSPAYLEDDIGSVQEHQFFGTQPSYGGLELNLCHLQDMLVSGTCARTRTHTHTHTSVFELYISFLSGFVSFISSMVI